MVYDIEKGEFDSSSVKPIHRSNGYEPFRGYVDSKNVFDFPELYGLYMTKNLGEKCIIRAENENDSKDNSTVMTLEVTLLDENFEEILRYENTIVVSDYESILGPPVYDRYGNVFFKKKMDRSKYTNTVYMLSPDGPTKIDIIEDYDIVSNKLYTNEVGNVMCYGVYNSQVHGTGIVDFNLADLIGMNKFSRSTDSEAILNRKVVGSLGLQWGNGTYYSYRNSIREILNTKDSGRVILSEVRYKTNEDNFTHYAYDYYGDIYITKLNRAGNVEWVKIIFKAQIYSKKSGGNCSFFSYLGENDLYLFYGETSDAYDKADNPVSVNEKRIKTVSVNYDDFFYTSAVRVELANGRIQKKMLNNNRAFKISTPIPYTARQSESQNCVYFSCQGTSIKPYHRVGKVQF